jgi:hypothetical protein
MRFFGRNATPNRMIAINIKKRMLRVVMLEFSEMVFDLVMAGRKMQLPAFAKRASP